MFLLVTSTEPSHKTHVTKINKAATCIIVHHLSISWRHELCINNYFNTI